MLCERLTDLRQLEDRRYIAKLDGQRAQLHVADGRADPDAHAFLGYIDYIGRRNIISGNGGLSVSPIRDLTLSVQQYLFWRASDRDAIYNKVGAVLRPGTGTTVRYVGAETDLLATYSMTRHLLLYGGYSHFFAGEFIKRSGPHKDSDFLYGALEYTF